MAFDRDLIFTLINLADRLEVEAPGSSLYMHPSAEDYAIILANRATFPVTFTLTDKYPVALHYKGLILFDARDKEEQDKDTVEVEQCLNP